MGRTIVVAPSTDTGRELAGRFMDSIRWAGYWPYLGHEHDDHDEAGIEETRREIRRADVVVGLITGGRTGPVLKMLRYAGDIGKRVILMVEKGSGPDGSAAAERVVFERDRFVADIRFLLWQIALGGPPPHEMIGYPDLGHDLRARGFR
ncbi:MAG: hypothetical protein MPJ08_01160 [Nitrosopumilus sp.]|nr:hypothetical protein [Nitrosopumilus sp.]